MSFYTREEIRNIAREEIRDDKWRDFWISKLFGGKSPPSESKVEEISREVVSKYLQFNGYTTKNDVSKQIRESNFITKREVQGEINSKIGDLKLSLQDIVSQETIRSLSSQSGVENLLNEHRSDIKENLLKHDSEIKENLESHTNKIRNLHDQQLEKFTQLYKKEFTNYSQKLHNLGSEVITNITDTSMNSEIYRELKNQNKKYLDEKVMDIKKDTECEIKSLKTGAICVSLIVGLFSGIAGIALGSYISTTKR